MDKFSFYTVHVSVVAVAATAMTVSDGLCTAFHPGVY